MSKYIKYDQKHCMALFDLLLEPASPIKYKQQTS